MMHHQRIPTMTNSLETLLRCGVKVEAVIDVGVLNGTPPLMRVFSHLRHYLFEPVEFHFDKIKHNYKNIDYELFNIALSDSEDAAYLVGRSVDGGDTVTHSHISDEPVTDEQDKSVLVCNEIRKKRLDSVLDEIEIESPYLLKIDVDGHEIPILNGAERTLENASIVVIEAPLQKRPLPQFLVRYQHLVERGFVLMDMVDFAYYGGILWQVDLVFVRQEIANSIDQLRPFESESFKFNRELWYPLTPSYFEK